MNNYLLCITFNGKEYHGWQKQPEDISVSSVMEDCVEKITGQKTVVKGCGRTDSGVHAVNYYCNFSVESRLSADEMQRAMNYYLPYSISVKSARIVDKDFHSRFSAISKTYIYKIYPSKIRNPFYDGLVLDYTRSLDIKKLNEVAEIYLGKHDFTAFSASGTDVEDKIREIYESEFSYDGDLVIYRVTGNGFLYNMVRIMVGTALYYNEGKIKLEDIKKLFETKNRSDGGKTVSGKGLYLLDVDYGEAVK